MALNNKIVLDPFCYRQFDLESNSSQKIPFDRQKFVEIINQNYSPENLKDGYASFCKHLFVENFTETLLQTIEINEQNKNLLQSCYKARTEKELPVLVRYFNKADVQLEKAKYLDIILYSKDQIQLENEAMGNVDPNKDIDYDYGIVSVKPQNQNSETPMDPITILRNALGKDQGGSGVALDRKKYLESVEFWQNHANVV